MAKFYKIQFHAKGGKNKASDTVAYKFMKTKESAERQMAIERKHFPNRTYYIRSWTETKKG